MKHIFTCITLGLLIMSCAHEKQKGPDAGAGYSHSDPRINDIQEQEMSQGEPQDGTSVAP